jgi:hypothetical protein
MARIFFTFFFFVFFFLISSFMFSRCSVGRDKAQCSNVEDAIKSRLGGSSSDSHSSVSRTNWLTESGKGMFLYR